MMGLDVLGSGAPRTYGPGSVDRAVLLALLGERGYAAALSALIETVGERESSRYRQHAQALLVASPSSAHSCEAAPAPSTMPASSYVHIDYASHYVVSDPIEEERLDRVLRLASSRVRAEDFHEDYACCFGLRRGLDGGSFGRPGDGLDSIDTWEEMSDAMSARQGRIKQVRLINFCFEPVLNALACAWTPGVGGIVVRQNDVDQEAVQWAHVFAHNAGNCDNDDPRFLMHQDLNQEADGLSAIECSRLQNEEFALEAPACSE